jgi:DNA polymerase III alpha subunit
VADLVAQIAPSVSSEPAAQAAIAAFAGSLSQSDKDRMLSLAFAGVLEVLNRDRATLIDGIERYARDQSRRAEALGQELDRMVQLEKDGSESAAQERQELKKRLTLEERVFDERERAIQFLCTRPIAVERRIGFLARTISGYLD